MDCVACIAFYVFVMSSCSRCIFYCITLSKPTLNTFSSITFSLIFKMIYKWLYSHYKYGLGRFDTKYIRNANTIVIDIINAIKSRIVYYPILSVHLHLTISNLCLSSLSV